MYLVDLSNFKRENDQAGPYKIHNSNQLIPKHFNYN